MTPKSKTLYSLENKDILQAVDVLVDAFKDDPVYNAIFEGAQPEQRRAFSETPLRYCMKYGQVCAPSNALEGVAGWVGGKHSEMTPWRMLVSGAIWSGFKMGGEYSQRVGKVFRQIEEDRKNHMGDRPYMYLFFIGVAGEHQGKGYGRVLLDEVIRVAEEDRLPVYLETETTKNVQLYEHFGFEVIEKVDLPLIDLPMWKMVRNPG